MFCIVILLEVFLTCFELELNGSRETSRYNEPYIFPVTDSTENGLLLLFCFVFCFSLFLFHMTDKDNYTLQGNEQAVC